MIGIGASVFRRLLCHHHGSCNLCNWAVNVVSIPLVPVVGAVCCVGDGAGDGAGVVDRLPSAAIIFAISACCLAILA